MGPGRLTGRRPRRSLGRPSRSTSRTEAHPDPAVASLHAVDGSPSEFPAMGASYRSGRRSGLEVPVVVVLVAAPGKELLADKASGCAVAQLLGHLPSAAQITNSPRSFDLGAGMCERWAGAPAAPIVVGASRPAPNRRLSGRVRIGHPCENPNRAALTGHRLGITLTGPGAFPKGVRCTEGGATTPSTARQR